MSLFLASYDIEEKHRDEYQALWNYFSNLNAVRILYSEFAVPFNGHAIDLANEITAHLRSGDRLLVCELFDGKSGTRAWRRLMIGDEVFRKLLSTYARRLDSQ